MNFDELALRSPYTLPLAAVQFSRALRTGHGRALVHARAHGLSELTDALFNACLRNPCYDAQCESSRAPWLLQIADAGGLGPEWFADLMTWMDRVYEAEGERYGHQTDLLLQFAKRGVVGAGSRLRNRLLTVELPENHGEMYTLVELDGAAGLIAVAEVLGRHIASHPEYEMHDVPIRAYDRDSGKDEARTILRRAAENNRDVTTYVDSLARLPPRDRTERRRNPLLKKTGLEIANDIRGVQPSGISPGYWGRHAPVDEVRIVLEAAFAETDPKRVARGLSVVCNRQLPSIESRLLPYVDHPDKSVRFRAAQALQHYRDPRIRESAMRRIAASELDDHALLLFVGNYEPGDHALIIPAVEAALTRRPGDEDRHSVLSDMLDVLDKNPDPAAAPLALATYEYGPCSNCRRSAVNWLECTKTTPEWVREEYKSDCNVFDSE